MIPHHHYDFGMISISRYFNHTEHQSYNDPEDHHHHDAEPHKHSHSSESEKKNNHPFPFHRHQSAINDFDCLRIEPNRIFQGNPVLLAVLNSFFANTLTEPPEIEFDLFKDIPFLIITAFEPGATGLRAPPSIA